MVTPMESLPKTDSDTADGCPGADVDVDVDVDVAATAAAAAAAAAAEKDTTSASSIGSRGLRLGRTAMMIMMMDPFSNLSVQAAAAFTAAEAAEAESTSRDRKKVSKKVSLLSDQQISPIE